MERFIDPAEIWSFLNNAKPDKVRVEGDNIKIA